MKPATDLLAQSLVNHSQGHALSPGRVGASAGSLLSLDVVANFARFAESLLVKQLGPAAEAVIATQHDAIAQFISPDLADFAAKLADKFGSAHS